MGEISLTRREPKSPSWLGSYLTDTLRVQSEDNICRESAEGTRDGTKKDLAHI